MMRAIPLYVSLLASLCAVFGAEAAPSVPLGHRDFYPSDERPVGYRGDGSGWFPGATIVSEWWDGTPTQKDLPAEIAKAARGSKAGKYWDLDETAPKNIVWKTRMPSWANTQPLVVGDKVFTLNEFWTLSCVDANTGKILWTHSCSPWDAAGLDKTLVQKLENLYEIQQAALGFPYRIFAFGTCTRGIPIEEVASLVGDFEKDVPKMLEGLKQYDPENMPVYEAQSKRTLAAMEPLRHPDKLTIRNHQGYPRAIDPKSLADSKTGGDKEFRAFDQAILNRIKELGKIKACFQQPWGNMCGFCMQAPASDGKRVYARWYQGQMVCVDLDGKRLWSKFDEGCAGNPINGDAGNPPVLFDQFVGIYYPANAKRIKTVKAYDKNTGEQKWMVELKGVAGSSGVAPFVSMSLGYGGKSFRVLVLQNDQIVRCQDGMVVGEVPREGHVHYCSAVAVGDLYFRGTSKDGVMGFRLIVKDEKTVEATQVYTTSIRAKHSGIIATDKYLIDEDVVEIATGTQVGESVNRKKANQRVSDIVCGNLRIWCGEAGGGMLAWGPTVDHGWGGRRFDGKTLLPFTVEDWSDPTKPRMISPKNYLGGAFQPPVPWYEKWSPALYANPNYFDKSTGKPAHVLYEDTGVYPQGNRLFIRTVGHLYCIGDPKVPYDWNPQSRVQNGK